MKFSITGGSETFTLTGHEIDKLIRAGDGDAALLYLYILKTNGQSTSIAAAEALKKSAGWVADAMAKLSRIKMIELATDLENVDESSARPDNIPPLDEPREYTQEEVVTAINSDSGFTIVIDATARRLGKQLSNDDSLRLYNIYDNLRLPPEVILQLITHCINECRISGGGRMPNVRYIEKAAYTWEREGIFTIERAEEYLKALAEKRGARGKIKQLLQIRERELSDIEKRYVDDWIDMGFELDAIALAYNKTTEKAGWPAWSYMNTILKRWNEKGLHTEQQVQDKEGRGQGGGRSGHDARSVRSVNTPHTTNNRSGQKHGEPNREQMERMNRMLKKINNEEA